MTGGGQFAAAARAVARSSNRREVRRTMLEWAPRFHDAIFEKRIVPGERSELGMRLSVIPGRCGFTVKKGKLFFVSIGNQTSTAEKRFTLAHELGHVLLGSVDRSVVPLSRVEEEKLCEVFASRVVARRDEVQCYLESVGPPREIADLKRFARRFQITLRASLVVLDGALPNRWPVAFVAASLRRHPLRDVKGIRIDAAAADRRFYFPRDSRLGSLGFCELEPWVLREAVGAELKGHERSVEIPSRGGRLQAWIGPGDWVAQVHRAPGSTAESNEPGVLCRIEVERLKPRPARPRLRSRQARPFVEIPGQLRLGR